MIGRQSRTDRPADRQTKRSGRERQVDTTADAERQDVVKQFGGRWGGGTWGASQRQANETEKERENQGEKDKETKTQMLRNKSL